MSSLSNQPLPGEAEEQGLTAEGALIAPAGSSGEKESDAGSQTEAGVRTSVSEPSMKGLVGEATEDAEVAVPRVISLSRARMEEVVELEQRAYPTPWSPDLVRGEFYKDISFRLGLEVDGRIAAYAFTYLIPEDLHVLNIAVAPEHRGKGYGRFLLCNVLARAINCGARLASLEVRPSNAAARSLYYSLGFRQNGLRRNYYRDNGEDALLLERPMSPLDVPFFEKNSRSSLKG